MRLEIKIMQQLTKLLLCTRFFSYGVKNKRGTQNDIKLLLPSCGRGGGTTLIGCCTTSTGGLGRCTGITGRITTGVRTCCKIQGREQFAVKTKLQIRATRSKRKSRAAVLFCELSSKIKSATVGFKTILS